MKEKLKNNLSIILLIIFFILFLVQISDTRLKVKSWYNCDKAQDLLKTLTWLKEHSRQEDVILTTWTLGCQAATYTDRKVVATSKVYPSEIKAVAQRYRDISKFFFAQNQEDALKIIRKYNVKFIFFPKRFDFWICRYIGACDSVLNSNNIFDIQYLKTMIAQMLKKQTPHNFTQYHKSKYYLIYKFVGDV